MISSEEPSSILSSPGRNPEIADASLYLDSESHCKAKDFPLKAGSALHLSEAEPPISRVYVDLLIVWVLLLCEFVP